MAANNLGKVHTHTVYRSLNDVLKQLGPEWWLKLNEPVPVELQCKKEACSFAPPGHRSHPYIGAKSDYIWQEQILMIQYLVGHDLIWKAKGKMVWSLMLESRYLMHRSDESLRNHFQRKILPEIQHFHLPREWEDKFLMIMPK